MTLNQIIKRIETLALSHHQINSFFFGAGEDFDINGEIGYPACFLERRGGVIDRIEHQQFFNFRLYLLDLVPESTDTKGNEQEVLSDMSSVAADLVAMLMATEFQDDWVIGDLSPFTLEVEVLNDLDAGVYLDISIGVEFLADRCQVPADDVEFETDFDMARTKILTYTATGNEGDNFEVPGLAGKNVLAIYRAGLYRRGITTVPVDTEHIQVVGTDLGSLKGILSTTGFVSLQSGDGLINGEILDLIIYA